MYVCVCVFVCVCVVCVCLCVFVVVVRVWANEPILFATKTLRISFAEI